MKAVIATAPASAMSFATSLDAANVFHAIFRRKAQVGIQAVPDVVAIEHIGVHAAAEEFGFEPARDGRFARAGKTRQPDDGAAVAVLGRARLRGDRAFAPEDVFTFGLEASRCKRRQK